MMYLCSTILYEIFTGKWPLNFPTHSVIWMIGKGQQECVTHIQCPESLKVRISYIVELGDAVDRAIRVRALTRDIVLCSWTRHWTLTVPLSTQVHKRGTVWTFAGGNPAMDQHPIQGGVEILLVAYCFRNRYKPGLMRYLACIQPLPFLCRNSIDFTRWFVYVE